jgi:hypothetical protein
MGRRAKTVDETFYDLFASMSVGEQGIALRIMQELHRQAVKQLTKRREVVGEVLRQPGVTVEDAVS